MEPRRLLSYSTSALVLLVLGDIIWSGLTALHEYYILIGACIALGGLAFLGAVGIIKLIAIYQVDVIGEVKKPVRRRIAK